MPDNIMFRDRGLVILSVDVGNTLIDHFHWLPFYTVHQNVYNATHSLKQPTNER